MSSRSTTSFAPHTRTGWVGIVLTLVLFLVGLVVFVVSNRVTHGGSEAAPLWLRAAVPVAVLAAAIPAVVAGLRSRRSDRSTVGTVAVVIASAVGTWAAVTGVAGLFFE